MVWGLSWDRGWEGLIGLTKLCAAQITLKYSGNHISGPRIKVLDWVPSSPDMNIIEHVWDQMEHLV